MWTYCLALRCRRKPDTGIEITSRNDETLWYQYYLVYYVALSILETVMTGNIVRLWRLASDKQIAVLETQIFLKRRDESPSSAGIAVV